MVTFQEAILEPETLLFSFFGEPGLRNSRWDLPDVRENRDNPNESPIGAF